MLKLARWSTTHRKYVLLGWIVLLFGVNVIAQSAGTSYSNNFTLPNSDAQRAADLLQRSFPAQAGDRDTIVYKVSSGTVLDPAVKARMSAMFAEVDKLPHVTTVISPYAGAAAGKSISADGQIAFATVVFDEKANLLPKSAAERVVKVARAAGQPGLQVELGGQAIEATEQAGFGLSTAVGLLAAIVVLLLTFGSVVAMGLPIVTALFGLGTGLGAIALFTHVVDTPNFSSELAAMIGLGVGIDYALFILTRFREAYATPGPTFENPRESVVQALDTAGRAVLFAGCTVVIALLGMMLLGVSFLYGVAISASIGVLLVMLASLTLLPALLTTFGARVARPSRRARRRAAKAQMAMSAQVPAQSAASIATSQPLPVAAATTDARHGHRRGRHVAALEQVRAAQTVEHRDRLDAGDARDRGAGRPRCGSAPATPRTTPRARRPTAPTSCLRKASARASTGRCWSWRRCRRARRKQAAATGHAAQASSVGVKARLRVGTAPRGDRRHARRRGRRPGQAQPSGRTSRRSRSTRTPRRRRTRPPSS